MIEPPSSLGVGVGLVAGGERSARDLAALSRAALDRPLRRDAEVCVSVVADDALVLGAFERATGAPRDASPGPLLRRGSGGPTVRVGPGTVHVAVALAHPGVLVPCDEKRIVNRTVRPLLRALSRVGRLAHYFGRDWVAVAHRPVAWVGFGHDATTRRTLFEAFVAVRTRFAPAERASFLGKAQATLEDVGGAGAPDVDPARLAAAVLEAYAGGHAAVATELDWPEPPAPSGERLDADDDPPWAATAEEAIGLLGAGRDARGVFRVGGELLVSRDALASLEARADTAPLADLPRVVDETLAAPGVALDGVRSLATVLDVIARARAV